MKRRHIGDVVMSASPRVTANCQFHHNVSSPAEDSLFLTFTYRDFTFIVLVVSIIVDTCIAGPVRVVVGPALNTAM